MAQFYKVLKADPLGDPWTPNFEGAKPTQNFWCQLEGVDKNVSIGKQVPNTITPGEHVYGDLLYAKAQRSGNEYWKFKSQKVPEGVQRPASTPAQITAQAATGGTDMSATMPGWFQSFANILIDLQKDMKLLKGEDMPEDPAPKTESKGVEQIGGEPISEEEKARLDDIFTPPETPDDVSEKVA